MEYYTYAYLREDGTPYYIGKGKNRRAFVPHYGCNVKRPSQKDRILLLKTGLTEQEAFNHERYMIHLYGRKDLGTGILRNGTDGGEGQSGAVPTPESNRKRSESMKGTPYRGGSWVKGTPRSEETKRKLSAKIKGCKNPANDTKGRVWVNDGVKTYMIHPPIPPHLNKGRL